MNADPIPGVSVYDRLRRSDDELAALLAGGAARHELVAVFGAAEYTLLAALARRALRAPRRHAAPVYILPGIMGTQLGAARTAPAPIDLLWLDPQDIIDGALARLRLPEGAGLRALGAIPVSLSSLEMNPALSEGRIDAMHQTNGAILNDATGTFNVTGALTGDNSFLYVDNGSFITTLFQKYLWCDR